MWLCLGATEIFCRIFSSFLQSYLKLIKCTKLVNRNKTHNMRSLKMIKNECLLNIIYTTKVYVTPRMALYIKSQVKRLYLLQTFKLV